MCSRDIAVSLVLAVVVLRLLVVAPSSAAMVFFSAVHSDMWLSYHQTSHGRGCMSTSSNVSWFHVWFTTVAIVMYACLLCICRVGAELQWLYAGAFSDANVAAMRAAAQHMLSSQSSSAQQEAQQVLQLLKECLQQRAELMAQLQEVRGQL